MRRLSIAAMLLSGGLLLASCAGTDYPQTYQYNDSYRASDGYKNRDERPYYNQEQSRDERFRYDNPGRFDRYEDQD